MEEDEKFMKRAVELAKMSAGFVSPNPLVGAVIAKNGAILAEGRHRHFGDLHAETDAIKNAVEHGINIEGTTLYVNLEPCSHFGKQPPCVDAVIKNKISRVVFGMTDPNPLVSGRGAEKLRSAGIEVKSGILEKECRELNRFFIKQITTGIPYVVMKAAVSIDGSIACANGNANWISSPESRKNVHFLRSQLDAVLIGKNTAAADNPQLTVRAVEGRNPLRVVLDSRMELSPELNLFSDDISDKTYLFCLQKFTETEKAGLLEKKGVKTIGIDADENGMLDIKKVLEYLGKKAKINSVLIEGGAGVFTSFMKAQLIDEYVIYVCPKILGNGIRPNILPSVENVDSAEKIRFVSAAMVGTDIEIIGKKMEKMI